MSERENSLFLFDILIAIEKIRDIVKDYENAEELLYSYRDWDCLIREFEIIGEAMKKCIDYEIYDNDRDKRKVVDFRNILIHKYFGIDPEAVLNIVKENLYWLEDIIVQKIKNIETAKRDELIEYLINENHYLPFVIDRLQKLKNESK